MNLPVQDLNSKSGGFGKCKNWGFNFRNKKSQYFVDFSTDLDSPVLKFFRTGLRFAHIFE